MGRFGLNVEVRMNAKEGDGTDDSPPTERESEDEDRNRWSSRSSNSLILPAPFENWVTPEKKRKR